MPASPDTYGSKARCWFAPDAVSEKLQLKNCKSLMIEVKAAQTKGAVGAMEGSKTYTETGPTGEKVDNQIEMTLTATSLASLKALNAWIDKYQVAAYGGGAAPEVASTTGVITICNRIGKPILEIDLEGLVPISCSSPAYKAEDPGQLDYNVKCQYTKMKKPRAV